MPAEADLVLRQGYDAKVRLVFDQAATQCCRPIPEPQIRFLKRNNVSIQAIDNGYYSLWISALIQSARLAHIVASNPKA